MNRAELIAAAIQHVKIMGPNSYEEWVGLIIDIACAENPTHRPAKHVAHLLFGVGNQFEGELKLHFEVVVGLHVVPGHAEHRGTRFDEFFVLIAKLHGLRGATGRVVFWVKIQDDDFSKVRSVGDFDTTGGIGIKFRDGFIDNNRHGYLISCDRRRHSFGSGGSHNAALQSPPTTTADFTLKSPATLCGALLVSGD